MSGARTAGFADINWGLLGLMMFLLGFGLLMLTSASISVAENSLGSPFYYLIQQLVAVFVGLLVGAIMLTTPTDYWEKLGPLLLLIAILALIAVLIPGVGREINGGQRWIRILGVNLQVSEPARLLVLMYLAGYVVKHRDNLNKNIREVFKPILVVTIVCVLLLLEPDFGATCLMLLISMSVLFVGGVRKRYFIGVGAGAASLLGLLAVAEPYRMRRLTGFTDPWGDPFGNGFQLTQSLIAIGSGEMTGSGLGNSVQKLFYLPEAHTDFVFAVIAEEFGLLGTILLIGLFGALVWRIVRVASDAANIDRPYQAYLAFGIAVWIGAQVFINLGVNMGILPTKGLTLPLISYGRSSLIVILAALALVLRIDMENHVLRPSLRKGAA